MMTEQNGVQIRPMWDIRAGESLRPAGPRRVLGEVPNAARERACAPRTLKFPGKRCAAFTLVEVVLAIGIIAVAFVPLVALLPAGLGMSRNAIDTTIVSHIAQQLATEAQQTDFSVLVKSATSTDFKNSGANGASPSYFDEQGNKTTTPTGAIYEAGFVVAPKTTLPGVKDQTTRLATVTMYVLNITSNRTSQDPDPTKNPDWKTFSVLIPDNGR